MHLNTLQIIQFKNYSEASLTFSPKLNFFTGPNGAGKTNLMDAIYYLSFCKSFFNSIDSQNITSDKDFFLLQGLFSLPLSQNQVSCAVKRNQKKVFKLDENEYEKLADHIGLIPLVFITPNDNVLINGGSEERRRFIDNVMSQCDRIYLQTLINYNKILAQRNALLKSFAERNFFDASLLDVYDIQLSELGSEIFNRRKAFLAGFVEVFAQVYQQLSKNGENPEIQYISQIVNQDLKSLLKETLPKDKALQFTSCGIHKDNLDFFINGMHVKKFGSQGQQKTFVIAMKLAQYYYIKTQKNLKPILLFDDIFDKLDPQRVRQLIQLVSGDDFGQVFISDTHPDRVFELAGLSASETRVFEVDNASVTLK